MGIALFSRAFLTKIKLPIYFNKFLIPKVEICISFVDEDDDGQNSIVVEIEVTSPKWEVASGISVGASLADVQTKFVQTDKPTKEKGLEKLSYFVNEGYANFYFRNKKLVKVNWEFNLC